MLILKLHSDRPQLVQGQVKDCLKVELGLSMVSDRILQDQRSACRSIIGEVVYYAKMIAVVSGLRFTGHISI